MDYEYIRGLIPSLLKLPELVSVYKVDNGNNGDWIIERHTGRTTIFKEQIVTPILPGDSFDYTSRDYDVTPKKYQKLINNGTAMKMRLSSRVLAQMTA